MFGTITDEDRLIWQRQAAHCLVELLAQATRKRMPYVSWQIGVGKLLVGQCRDRDMEARRAAFIAWAEFLGIADWRERKAADGVTYLHGKADAVGKLRVSVVITADLYESDGGDQQ